MLSATFPGISSRSSPILPTTSRPSSRNSNISPTHSTYSLHNPSSSHTTTHTAPRFSSVTGSGRVEGPRIPLFFRRLLKFPQMDFEMAIWEMTRLIISPKKVFRSIYYHKQMKNTWARDDPSFVVLLSLFLVLTSIAWGSAMAPSFVSTLRLMLVMTFGHFLLLATVVATVGWWLAGRFLRLQTTTVGRGGEVMAEGELEWAYCFDVAVRAFFTAFFFLYVAQFLLWPVLTRDYWISLFLGNSLYLVAFVYYCVITFLGYNALPFLQHTEIILFPIFVFVILWAASLFGFNIAKHFAPLLLSGV